MTSEEMQKVLAAVTVCYDHIEATPIMVKLAGSFPEHRAALDAAFEEHYAYDFETGRYDLARAIADDEETTKRDLAALRYGLQST